MRTLYTVALLAVLTACQSPRQTVPPSDVTPPSKGTSTLPLTEPNAPSEAHLEETPPQISPPTPKPALAVARFLDPDKLARVDTAINQAIANGKTPGGVLWVERKGQVYHKAFGNRAVFPDTESTDLDTIYDLASLTKVIATAPAILALHETGKLDLNDPVAKFLPEFAAENKGNITLTHLLTHSSGLRPGLSLKPDWVGSDHAIQLACAETLRTNPGTEFKYSDINFILLGRIVEIVSGQPLQEFVQERLYRPLGMNDTRYLPSSSQQDRIAPTTRTEDGVTRGVVHDPTSARMGGVAGHAGLFATTADIARFARMLLSDGRTENDQVFRPETIALMTRNHSPPAIPHQRGLGWDIASPYSSPRGHLFEIGSYGHTGWTGTSVWIDPNSETFVVFLANRNHPTEDGSVIALRREISTLVAEAVLGYDFPKKSTAASPRTQTTPSPDLGTLNGIDVLKKEGFQTLEGKKIGLITNHTGQSREKISTIDLLHQAPNVNLVALFSPEHGIRGTEDSKVKDGQDAKTGLPIFSLYGETRKPTSQQLEGIETLVFDIQDIGCRFYTYISTMGLAMEAAAEAGISFVVLDRVNPIAGNRVEGPLLTGKTSFIGFHPLPVRHGMTTGELARLFAAERQLDLDLKVVGLVNWRRNAWFDETGLPWINPSPNMRSLTEAALYPGIGLLEFTKLSVGRGTATPFEVIGAPYLDAPKLAKEINELAIPGIEVTAIDYTPESSVFADTLCHGLRFKILDRDRFHPIALSLNIARILARDYPEQFDLEQVDRLLGNQQCIEGLRKGLPYAKLRNQWQASHQAFLSRIMPHLLYL